MSKLMGVERLFEGRHFDREVIILCVRWYLRFKLSLRDLVEMMAERGLSLAHATIMRWVWRYAPEFQRSAGSGSPGRSAGHGGWTRHTSKFEANGTISIVPWIGQGRPLTSRLSAKRDVAAAKAFFRKAIKKASTMLPGRSLWMAMPRLTGAVRELKADGLLPAETKLRSSKYLNNLIEQDHRGVKQRIATMLGFKGFATAAILIAGIELMHRIRKEQFGLGRPGCPRSTCACSVECRAPSSEISTVQHGTLSGAGYFAPEPMAATIERGAGGAVSPRSVSLCSFGFAEELSKAKLEAVG